MNKTASKESAKRVKRVFHVVTHFDVGGAEEVAAGIARSATPGVEYHIVEIMRARTAYTRLFKDRMRDAGIICHRAFMPDIQFHFLFERIAAVCFPLWFVFVYLRWRPDVIHTHTETPDMSVCLLFTLCPWLKRCRIIRTVHNTRLWTGQPKLGRRIETFYQRLGANVAISESVRESYLREYGQDLRIIHNGVEPVPQKAWPELHEGRINVLFAGRIELQKGISRLIDTLRMMAGDDRYFFHIVGDGSLRADVEQCVSCLDNATLYPPVYGLSSYLSSFDCLFMPSEFEGLSILSIEASMAALPVVANDCPGLGDTLPPDWPLKARNNDMHDYRRIFRDILPTADLTELGRQSRLFATRHFGIRRMQEAYEKLYFGVGPQPVAAASNPN